MDYNCYMWCHQNLCIFYVLELIQEFHHDAWLPHNPYPLCENTPYHLPYLLGDFVWPPIDHKDPHNHQNLQMQKQNLVHPYLHLPYHHHLHQHITCLIPSHHHRYQFPQQELSVFYNQKNHAVPLSAFFLRPLN